MAKWFDAKLSNKIDSKKQQNQNVIVGDSGEVLYDIGMKLGRIDSATNSTKNELRKINQTLIDHEKRISRIEIEVKK